MNSGKTSVIPSTATGTVTAWTGTVSANWGGKVLPASQVSAFVMSATATDTDRVWTGSAGAMRDGEESSASKRHPNVRSLTAMAEAAVDQARAIADPDSKGSTVK